MVKKVLFFSLTIAVFVSAWLVSEQKKIKSDISRNTLYPELINQLNFVSEIKIRSGKKSITVKKKNTSWVLIESDNFPAKPEVVKKILLQVARLSILEKKTKSNRGHKVLGVNELDEDGIPRRQITLLNEGGVSFVDFIVGKNVDQDRKVRHYIRQSKDDQSWISEGNLDFSAEPVDWFDSKIMDIDPESIKSIQIIGNGGSSILVNKADSSQTFLQLQNIPDDQKARSTTLISSFASLLSDMRFNKVLSSGRLKGKVPIRETTASTFENLKIIMKDYLIEKDVFTSFDFEKIVEGSESENRLEEIEAYREKTKQWIYQLPKYKRRIIERQFENLIWPKD